MHTVTVLSRNDRPIATFRVSSVELPNAIQNLRAQNDPNVEFVRIDEKIYTTWRDIVEWFTSVNRYSVDNGGCKVFGY